MNIFDILFRRKPVKKSALLGSRHELPAIAQTIDAGRLSDILRAAEGGNMTEYFALARDVVSGHGHTQAEFGKRKLAVLAKAQTIIAVDPKQAAETAIAEGIGNHLEDLTGWFDGMVHLLDSTVYPVSVLEKVFKPSLRPGWRFEIADLIPVPYRLLDYSTGTLRIKDTGPDGQLIGTTHAPDPMRYVVHRGHLLTSTPDTWGGPMRAILFWWLFAVMDRDWWARFLERFGAPFLKGKYNKDDNTSRILLERAFASATRLFGIAIPDDSDVEIQQANSSQGGDAFEKFHGVANREISKIVLGQTLSADGQSLGLGGGQATTQADVRDDIRQFDAVRLAATVRTQILGPLCRLNGWTVPTPRIAWGGDDISELDLTGDLLKSLRDAGLRITDDGIGELSKRLALPLEREVASPAPSAPTKPALGQLSALGAPMRGRASVEKSDAARQAVDQLAEHSAQTLSAALATALRPLAALVDESTSLSDLESRLRQALPELDMREAAAAASGVLTAASVNAALTFRER